MRWRRRRPDLRAANAVKAVLPRCGAKCRDGNRCRNPGVGAGGRCHRHGGHTPSGSRWHVVSLPPDGPRRERKIAALARRRKKRAAEIAAMSSEERARYDAWCRTHKPGRRADRARAKRDHEALQFLQRPKVEYVDPDVAALEAKLAELNAERARLEALVGTQTQDKTDGR